MWAMGPAPYNVDAVALWSVGSVCAAGTVVTTAVKVLVVRRMRGSANPTSSLRVVAATAVESLLLIGALYLLQIPVETSPGFVTALLAGFFVGSGTANWAALNTGPIYGHWRRVGWVSFITLIFPVVQSGIAILIGPSLITWFIRMFP
jgi:hypothetical protein